MLRFDEAVATVPGSVRVFDSDVRRVDSGNVEKPTSDSVSVGLPRRPAARHLRRRVAGHLRGLPSDAWRVRLLGRRACRRDVGRRASRPRPGSGVSVRRRRARGRALRRPRADPAVRRRVRRARATWSSHASCAARWHWAVLALAGVLLALDSARVDRADRREGSRVRAGRDVPLVAVSRGARHDLREGVGGTCAPRAGRDGRRRPCLAWAVRSEGRAPALAAAIAVTPALSGHARIEGAFAVV